MRSTTCIFKWAVSALGVIYVSCFAYLVVPTFFANPDLIGGYQAGFVNPYAAAYSMDAVLCWFLLLAWVLYEAKTQDIKHGWIAMLVGVLPGTAAGLALYLLIRLSQQRRHA